MTREEAKDKIGKLLALAKRPGTVAEGEAAMARAEALAARHGFRIQKVRAYRRQERPFNINDFLRQRAAETDWARTSTETKRQRTARRRSQERGAWAFRAGTPITQNPYRYATVFGVNHWQEWRTGWENARDRGRTT